jgi:hypothetical protein
MSSTYWTFVPVFCLNRFRDGLFFEFGGSKSR